MSQSFSVSRIRVEPGNDRPTETGLIDWRHTKITEQILYLCYYHGASRNPTLLNYVHGTDLTTDPVSVKIHSQFLLGCLHRELSRFLSEPSATTSTTKPTGGRQGISDTTGPETVIKAETGVGTSSTAS